MLTKQQKANQIEEGEKLLDKSQSLIFVDFTGTSVENMKKARRSLKGLGAKLQVIKKKLLRIAFEKKKIDFNPEQFESQLGTVFSENEIVSVADPVYKSGLKILGGYDLRAMSFLDADKVKFIGQLPPREILLGQLVGMFVAPIKMFLHVLNEKSKMVENK